MDAPDEAVAKVVETDLNVSKAQRACVAATGLGTARGSRFSLVCPGLGLLLPLSLAAIVGLNRDFYRFLVRRRGLAFAVGSTAMHLLYYCCCGASVVIALAIWHGLAAVRGRPGDLRCRLDGATCAEGTVPRCPPPIIDVNGRSPTR